MLGHYAHPDAAGLPILGRGAGLGDAESPVLAALQEYDAEFRIQALEEALARYGLSQIFNTDQGSQFTSPRFIDFLKDGVRVSMDGRGRWMDNVFIARLWRSLKCESV